MYEYELIFDTGVLAIVQAKTRGQAIKKYCDVTGCSKEWVDAHCKVKNMGRVK